jgi:hypothetical protein
VAGEDLADSRSLVSSRLVGDLTSKKEKRGGG